MARNLNCLPPISFDHLDATNLLKDILIFKNDLQTIKENYVTTSQLQQTKEEMCGMNNLVSSGVRDCNNINKKRRGPAFMNSFVNESSPMGLHTNDSQDISQYVKNESLSKLYTEILRVDLQNEGESHSLPSSVGESSMNALTLERQGDSLKCVESATENTQGVGRPTGAKKIDREALGAQNTEQIIMSPLVVNKRVDGVMPKMDNIGIEEQPWQEVISKRTVRKQNPYNGRIGKASENNRAKFKAAQTKIPLLITNVNKDTDDKDVSDYIVQKTGEKVDLVNLKIKRGNLYKAYKIFVPGHKLRLFLDDKFWPTRVIFRCFIYYHKKVVVDEATKINKNDDNKQ